MDVAIAVTDPKFCHYQQNGFPFARSTAILMYNLKLQTRYNKYYLSGSPGTGKSTFIETFGLYLIEQGYIIFLSPYMV